MKTITTILISTALLFSANSSANSGASEHASVASKHSALSVYHGTKASVKIGSAVLAVPFVAAGAVGTLSMQVGTGLMDSAASNDEFEVTDKTITVAPSPMQIMNANKEGQL